MKSHLSVAKYNALRIIVLQVSISTLPLLISDCFFLLTGLISDYLI